MMKLRTFSLLAATVLMPASLLAQAPAAAPAGAVGSIHGHVTNAAGLPASAGKVQLTQDKRAPTASTVYKNGFDVDTQGDYKGTGVAPGEYFAYFLVNGATIDRMPVTAVAGQDVTVNFDMTRKEYLDNMSPADRAALEEYKKKTAEALKANSVVANLNTSLKTVHDDLKAATPNFDQDQKLMQDATVQKPDESVLWYNLGAVDIAYADSKAKAAKAAHQSTSDESITKLYADGITAYQKGIELNDASKKPVPADAGIAWNSIGNAQAKLGKITESQAAFDNAVKLAPASAGMVYGNEAAVLFNAGQSDAAAAAADKAIAAEPNRADPYYVKGQALVAKSTVDSATGKIAPPPGCVEAYQKYLELAPDGAHAAEVKDVLAGLGQAITTSYKAPKNSKPAKK